MVLDGIHVQQEECTAAGSSRSLPCRASAEVAAWVQAVTRQIMGIGQELTYAKERVALLDEAPKSNGSVAPQPVSAGPYHAPGALKAALAALFPACASDSHRLCI